ncbi:hypothetical protein K4F52_010234 [Lecanicillium sp. MT-2017a]|nr:hypothetical protein K4F52_010234 [Lecanicillium sp. MT-2017a]
MQNTSIAPPPPPSLAHQNADLDARAAALTEAQLTDARHAAGLATGFPYPPNNPIFYIKFGNQPRDLTLMEARTHRFVFDELEKMRRHGDMHDACDNRDQDAYGREAGQIPHIPRILRVVETGMAAFIIMEFIHGATLLDHSATQQQLDQVAGAIRTLLAIRVPPNTPPGPYQGGLISHPLFKNGRAPKTFSSITDLEVHIQMICDAPQRKRTSDIPRLDLERRLCVVHADPYPGNFLFDAMGRLFVLDFGDAALLPPSFQSYALCFPNPKSAALARSVWSRLALELPHGNLATMARAAALFARCQTYYEDGNSTRYTTRKEEPQEVQRVATFSLKLKFY